MAASASGEQDARAGGAALASARLARGSALHCLGRLVEAGVELEAALAAMRPDDHEQRLTALRELWSVGVYRQSAEIMRRAGHEALGPAWPVLSS